MRRGAGIAGLDKKRLAQKKYAAKGDEVNSEVVAKMLEGLPRFRKNLEEFALKHKNDINRNPEFRYHFQKMCSSIGVDPLASNKGFWAQILGVGDFYYELGVEIIDVCVSTRSQNGGLIDLAQLRDKLEFLRGSTAQAITVDDVERSIRKLKVLGGGYDIISAGSKRIVQAVPVELNRDHTDVLVLAQGHGYVTETMLRKDFGWPQDRISHVLEFLLKEGMAWLDSQSKEPSYWLAVYFTS